MMANKYQMAIIKLAPRLYSDNKTIAEDNLKQLELLQELVDLYAKKSKTRTCDLHKKCGACIYLDYNDSSVCGYRCKNDEKKWEHNISAYKEKTEKCCKKYVERNDIELVYEYKRGRKQR